MKNGLFLLMSALLLSGCVDFSYDGRTLPETGNEVAVYTDATTIGRTYDVLGSASASGDYDRVGRDKLRAKLLDEAKKAGADAILITEQQVVQTASGERSAGGRFSTSFDYNNESESWQQIYRGVDNEYGSVRDRGATTAPVNRYKRILRAEFLKFKSE